MTKSPFEGSSTIIGTLAWPIHCDTQHSKVSQSCESHTVYSILVELLFFVYEIITNHHNKLKTYILQECASRYYDVSNKAQQEELEQHLVKTQTCNNKAEQKGFSEKKEGEHIVSACWGVRGGRKWWSGICFLGLPRPRRKRPASCKHFCADQSCT